MENAKRVSLINEIANTVTHGIGTALSIAALVLLVVFAVIYGDVWHVVSFSIFGSSLVLLYLASTLYHGFRNPRIKKIFKIIDHSAIYLLIAGTYTPFTLVTLRGTQGWVLFGVIWGLAVAGILYKAFFINRHVVISTLFYLAMGWLIVFSLRDLIENMPLNGIIFLVSGGLFYTLGMIFYAGRDKLFHHAVWHLFVLGGSICHFFSILFYVLPLR